MTRIYASVVGSTPRTHSSRKKALAYAKRKRGTSRAAVVLYASIQMPRRPGMPAQGTKHLQPQIIREWEGTP